MQGGDVWKAFNLPGRPPEAVGVYENQPSPMSGSISSVSIIFAALVFLLIIVAAIFTRLDRNEEVLAMTYRMNSGDVSGESSFVTEPFELKGRISNVELTTEADLSNNWIYLNYALINQDTSQAWDFGREVSYYYGYDSDGSWSEGSTRDVAVIPSVPPGIYYLRIEPEADVSHPRIVYSVIVKRDVPVLGFYALGFVALLLPAVGIAWRSMSFERSRWSESDHPPTPIFDS